MSISFTNHEKPIHSSLPTSERLRLQKEDILSEWKERVCDQIPAAKSQSRSQLRDSLPRFLDRIASLLSHDQDRKALIDEVNDVSQDHGLQRSELHDYSLYQVLSEYHILREVMFRILEHSGTVYPDERDIILSSIEQGMAEAGSIYIQLSQRESIASKIIIEGIRDHGIIRLDTHGTILDWNSGAEKIFQYTREEIVGKKASIIFTMEDLARNADKKEMNQARTFGRAEDMRWHVKKDGSVFFANGIMNPLVDENMNVFGFVKVLRDDTERARIEAEKNKYEFELSKIRERLSLAIESSDIGIWSLDLRTKTYHWSEKEAELLGYPKDRLEMPLEEVSKIIHPEDAEKNKEALASIIKKDEPYFMEFRVILPSGGQRWLYGSGKLIKDPDGQPLEIIGTNVDITDRKKSVDLLKSERTFLLSVLDHIPAAVWILEAPSGKVLIDNPIARSFMQQPPGPVKSIRDYEGYVIYHPDGKKFSPEEYPAARAILNGETIVNEEVIILRKDGTRGYAQVSAGPMLDAHNNIFAAIVVSQDITEKKIAELKVEDSRKVLYSFFMQSPTPMVILSGPHHRFALANAPYEKLVGRKVTGKTVLEAFSEEEVKQFIPMLDKVFNTGEPIISKSTPFKILGADAVKELWVDFNYYPFRADNGQIIGILADVHDVSELVLAQRKIKESEERFRELANALPQIIWTATADFFVDWYNDWWYSYLGLPVGTRWDDPLYTPMLPEDVIRTQEMIKECVESGKNFEMEQRFRRGSDGQYRWHLVRGIPIRDKDGKIVKWIGANTDIHDQKIILEKLEEERELRDKFVATLSHDLRTPLTAAKISAQVLGRKLADQPNLFSTAHKIASNMDRADRMIRDLLDVSFISAGEVLPLKKEVCSLKNILEDTVEELSMLHGERFVITGMDVEGNWDHDALKRVFENLLGNAIKYGYQTTPVTLTLHEDEENAIVSVHNEGAPISMADQALLFEKYRRSESARRGDQKGWGLGLTLVKGFVEAHHGYIDVQSSLESGTTFVIRLPKNVQA